MQVDHQPPQEQLSNFTIRPATVGDLERLVVLHQHLARIHGVVLARSHVCHGVRSLAQDAALGEILVAEIGGQAVGQLELKPIYEPWLASPYFYIDNAVVHPDHRGSGIGSALLARAKECARSQSIPFMRLYVSDNNRNAARVKEGYRKSGFGRIGELFECPL